MDSLSRCRRIRPDKSCATKTGFEEIEGIIFGAGSVSTCKSSQETTLPVPSFDAQLDGHAVAVRQLTGREEILRLNTRHQ
jgi:hypothetical protein